MLEVSGSDSRYGCSFAGVSNVFGDFCVVGFDLSELVRMMGDVVVDALSLHSVSGNGGSWSRETS